MIGIMAMDQPVEWSPDEVAPIVDEALAPAWSVGTSYALWLAGIVLTIWMAVSCFRRDSERDVWLWIILFFPGVGPLIYFVARWLPSSSWELPAFMKRWMMGGQIQRLEIAARQIGNPHQFIEWGDGLREAHRWNEAQAAYTRALEREPDNIMALWGSAQVEYSLGNWSATRDRLQTALAIDSAYKFGDASLLMGKALHALGDTDAEIAHWQSHLKRWRQPEAQYLLAERLIERGSSAEAQGHLESLIADIEVTPRTLAQQQWFWKGRARRLLKKAQANCEAR